MKRTILAALVAAFAASVPASAATLWVGHGIDGRDLGQPKALPVDVCLAGGPTLATNVPFGAFAEFKDLDAGRYDVEVRLANGACSGPVAIAASIFLGFGENATALAHLNEQGAPTITKFTNDLSSPGAGKARVVARHAAAFGDVNVYVRSGGHPTFIRDLENPDQEAAIVAAGDVFVGIYVPARWGKPVFSATLPIPAGTAAFAYAVGTPANGTFTVLTQALATK